jgi:murein DD-endopeptidase MepM/ murein hydrolase activator NlpD
MKGGIKARHILFILVSTMLFTLGQGVETERHKAVVDQFTKNYNADDYEKIFSAFDEAMQKALPMQETEKFFSGVKKGYGNITERELIRSDQIVAQYKVRAERGTFTLTVSVDADDQIIGLFIKPFVDGDLPKMDRTKTNMILPFNGEWTLFWGGDTPEQNYHVGAHPSQKHAFDFVVRDERGRSYRTSGQTNEDFYIFGQELIAPCDGEIVLVVEGVKDNVPGQLNPFFPTGNTVILKTDNLEYLIFAHFKQHSIKVAQGQKVKRGDLLGLCGNSGNSSEAHLHFHVQNVEDLNVATGVKCYFADIIVNGEERSDCSPVRNDKVRNRPVP